MQIQLGSANNMGWVPSVSPGECHKHIYMATPLSILKKPKMVPLPEKRMELKAKNFGMPTQLNSTNNLGWVASGPLYVRLKMSKMVLLNKYFD